MIVVTVSGPGRMSMEVGSVPSKGQPPEEPQVLWEVVLSTLGSNPSRWSPLSLSEGFAGCWK